MSETTTKWTAPKAQEIGLNTFLPAITGGSNHVALRFTSATAVEPSFKELQADILKNLGARLRDDKSLVVYRRLKAEREASLVRKSEAELALSAMLSKRAATLEAMPENLGEVLVALDQQIAAHEAAVAKANDVVQTLDAPIKSATEALTAVVKAAATISIRDALSMLEARRLELAQRLARQNETVFDELARIEQRRINLVEQPQGPPLVHLFMAGV